MKPICSICGSQKTQIGQSDPPSHKDWMCRSDTCENLRQMEMPGGGPLFNIHHLKRQNVEGMTTREEEREALGDRWDDPRIGRAR